MKFVPEQDIPEERPKCGSERKLEQTALGLPARLMSENPVGEMISLKYAVRVRLVACPKCHFVELYWE